MIGLMGTFNWCVVNSSGIRIPNSNQLNSAASSFSKSSNFVSFTSDWCRSKFAFSASFMQPQPIPFSARSMTSPSTGATKNESGALGMAGPYDLLIVGPGVLGRIVAEKWRKAHPGSQIHGQTRTSDHHDELTELGISPSLKGTQTTHMFPYVIFCAPPYQNVDYPGDVRDATLKWNGEGSFVFTSSSAPYDCNDNSPCDEDTPVVQIGSSPRTDNLLKAEKVVLDAGGCVVRLAGLYKSDRGAHSFWLEKGSHDIRPDHILNLIHYEDAASLSICILEKNIRSRVFLGCDDHPLSRQELMDLVNKSGKYSKKFDRFTGTSDPLGKKLNNSKTRAELGWEPKYPSFEQFLESL